MTEIAIASPMLPKSIALFGGLEAHREFLGEAGFTGGLELHSLRGSVLGRELAKLAAGGETSASDVLGSGHQSYVTNAEGMMPHANGSQIMQSAIASIVFPGAEASLRGLSRYQQAVSESGMPVVVYPEIGRSDGYKNLPFSDKLFQPNVRNLKRWDVRTNAELIERAIAEGLTGITWDGYHYLRTDETNDLRMADWHEVLPEFLESRLLPIKEVHISIGRTERTEATSLMDTTRQEMGIFLSDPQKIGQTVTGQMLRMINESTGGNMRYVLEAHPTKASLPPGMSLKAAYKTFTRNLTVFLESN